MRKSFLDALSLWRDTGASANFTFAGQAIFVEFGEQLPSAIGYALQSSNLKQLNAALAIEDLEFALDDWLNNENICDIRDQFKVLELLILISSKCLAYSLVNKFLEIADSSNFTSMPSDWQQLLLSQYLSMIGQWCLYQPNITKAICHGDKLKVLALIDVVKDKKDKLDGLDTLVLLASIACMQLQCFCIYFKELYENLPSLKKLKNNQSEYDKLVLAFTEYSQNYKVESISIRELIISKNHSDNNNILMQYIELFPAESTTHNILSNIIKNIKYTVIDGNSVPCCLV